MASEGWALIAAGAFTVITTSDVDAGQGEFEIVQRKVYVPAPPAGVNIALRSDVLLN